MKALAVALGGLFLILCTPFGETTLSASSSLLSIVISAILPLVAIIWDCLPSPAIKSWLILLGRPMPGETIFSRVRDGKMSDPRFQLQNAQRRYKAIIRHLPSDEKVRRCYENNKWYRIYLAHHECGQVAQTNHDYLMCRDLYISSLGFLHLHFILLWLFSDIVSFSWQYLWTVIIIAVVLNLCARNKMNRFVTTVIAVDIAQPKKSKSDTPKHS